MLKLTEASFSDDPRTLYIRPSAIQAMYRFEDKHTTIVTNPRNFRVKETPEQILELRKRN